MAGYPPFSAVPINIKTWTEEATQSLNRLSIESPNGVRGTTVSLAIDLDENGEHKPAKAATHPDHPRRKLLRRDSLERREALLKGKEGSRRRTRWENDRLLNNPWAQAPLPIDWEVRPTYPRRNVPYYLAPLWDQKMTTTRTELNAERKNRSAQGRQEVPKELKEKCKRARAAKGLLRDLEEQIRAFISQRSVLQKPAQNPKEYELGSSDEEIVFVGRNGKMRDMPPSPKFQDGEESDEIDSDQEQTEYPDLNFNKKRLVFDSPADDRSASFRRWLVHQIALYYGLETWSRTIGHPARREAYVSFEASRLRSEYGSLGSLELPKPLWVMV